MAPQVSLADDVERLSVVLAGLARVVLAGQLPLSRLGKAAAAAGLSAEQAGAFLRGEAVLPSRQSVALVGAFLEQARAAQVSYMETLRGGHAGSDSQRGSYQAKVPGEGRVRARGGPLETGPADVEATLGRLAGDFPGWRFFAEGAESLSGEKPKVTWQARHAGHGQVDGVTSLEVAEKIQAIEAQEAENARIEKQYNAGGLARR